MFNATQTCRRPVNKVHDKNVIITSKQRIDILITFWLCVFARHKPDWWWRSFTIGLFKWRTKGDSCEERRPLFQQIKKSSKYDHTLLRPSLKCKGCQGVKLCHHWKHLRLLFPTHLKIRQPQISKGPYLPCVSMAGRALLAGYPRFTGARSLNEFQTTISCTDRYDKAVTMTTSCFIVLCLLQGHLLSYLFSYLQMQVRFSSCIGHNLQIQALYSCSQIQVLYWTYSN